MKALRIVGGLIALIVVVVAAVSTREVHAAESLSLEAGRLLTARYSEDKPNVFLDKLFAEKSTQ